MLFLTPFRQVAFCHLLFFAEFPSMKPSLVGQKKYIYIKKLCRFFDLIFVDQMNHDSAVAEEIAAPLQDGKAGVLKS